MRLSIPLSFAREVLAIPTPGPDALVDELVLAEFAAASLLIAAGAVLGQLTMPQYLLLGALFVNDALDE